MGINERRRGKIESHKINGRRSKINGLKTPEVTARLSTPGAR